MSQLIHLRHRIKAIETIKKITQAMRLIAMSAHSQLKNKQERLFIYQKKMSELMSKISTDDSLTFNNIQLLATSKKKLIILVGSQKGLCGSFNSSLLSFFRSQLSHYSLEFTDFIIIGQRISQLLTHLNLISHHETYSSFTAQDIPKISEKIINSCIETKQYNEVNIISNKAKTFFIQAPDIQNIFSIEFNQNMQKTESEKYIIEEPKDELFSKIFFQTLDLKIQTILFESLLAEQASRFIAMDQATRNAQNLYDATMLSYNKLRQTKITQELTELGSSFISID